MFFDFQFRSLCGIARIPYAAGGLEQQVVELPPQNYSVAKILKKARLQGPVSGCQNQPKTGYVRRYLQSKFMQTYPEHAPLPRPVHSSRAHHVRRPLHRVPFQTQASGMVPAIPQSQPSDVPTPAHTSWGQCAGAVEAVRPPLRVKCPELPPKPSAGQLRLSCCKYKSLFSTENFRIFMMRKLSALSPGQALQELGKNFSCGHTCYGVIL